MSNLSPTSIDPPTRESERIWPLDVVIGALAALVIYLVIAQLKFDDPRWQYNGWTYVVAVPAIAILLAGITRVMASKHVHKSLQLGFFSSVLVHLLLMILAINVVIFRNYFPEALSGVKQERTPIHRTIPDYVFRAANQTAPTPDWSKPVDSETASRIVPMEKRQIPAVDNSAAKIELPRPRDSDQRPIRKFLMKRESPAESLPQPADSPGRLASPRSAQNPESVPWTPQEPTAPDVKSSELPAAAINEQTVDSQLSPRQTEPARSVAFSAPQALPDDMAVETTQIRTRLDQQSMPEIQPSQVPRRQPQATRRKLLAAGASPSATAVAIRQVDEAVDRMSELMDAIPTAKSDTGGADVMLESRIDSSLAMDDNPSIVPITPQQRPDSHDSAAPEISAGSSAARSDRETAQSRRGNKFTPAGSPSESTEIGNATGDRPTGDQQISDRLANSRSGEIRASSDRRRTDLPPILAGGMSGPTLDLLLDNGPVGMATELNRNAGIVPGEAVPDIAALELSPGLKRRRDLGGPITPFGTKIAAVESFSRRIKRTEEGAAPTPGGAVGPATEEAIERGLEFLARAQNDDGSWSLQGHGSDVVLRSDTAATGLSLLAFQGAGYTHRQHKYADTVSRGLKFMLDNQKTNGDLYRPENQISNENVALYSHGIASLALCEAYGMTQDPELRKPAQECIRYIVETQNRRRGGWRYTPQVSSDTSVTGWMMMALKSGQLSGLEVPNDTYAGIQNWLGSAQGEDGSTDRYRYNPFAPDTPSQRHGRIPTPTMTAVGMLMRMYMGWHRDNESMQSAADYLMEYPPQMGTRRSPQRDGYYWYYATMVMFHMGGDHWRKWNSYLKPVLLDSQIIEGEWTGSWDPIQPVPDRWSPHAGRIYVTTMNLLNLEVYYRHLPIYDESVE